MKVTVVSTHYNLNAEYSESYNDAANKVPHTGLFTFIIAFRKYQFFYSLHLQYRTRLQLACNFIASTLIVMGKSVSYFNGKASY